MKSRRTHLAWMVSLVVHVCLAVVVGYIAISAKELKTQDAIDVSFFILTPPQAAKRDIVSKPEVVLPTSVPPDLTVVPETETTPRRTTLARASRSSATAAPAASLMGGAQPHREDNTSKFRVLLQLLSIAHNPCQPLRNYRRHQMRYLPPDCPVKVELRTVLVQGSATV